jgi:hypothetical protein
MERGTGAAVTSSGEATTLPSAGRRRPSQCLCALREGEKCFRVQREPAGARFCFREINGGPSDWIERPRVLGLVLWPRRGSAFPAQAQVVAWARGSARARCIEQAVGRLLQAGPRKCLRAREQAFGPSRELAQMNSNICFLSIMLFSEANLMNNVIL